MQNGLTIAGRTYASRLLVGTGKYRGFEETRMAIDASGTEIVTVTIRRVNIGQASNEPNLLDFVPPSKYTILPNTASCYTAKDAVYTLQLARELLGDEKTLFPNMPETLKAAEALVKDGFDVMVYCGDDPIQAKLLEQIGSSMGILNPWNLSLIIAQANVPGWSMPASARPPMRRLRWSSAATAC